ncbi:MAG TPA: isopropylmalate/homocitrate/citramalate synthase, partial [Roseovarius sp.]|nr:isopropylmalate/homocitrate/citramalate synthase [Roseovarius sp.]
MSETVRAYFEAFNHGDVEGMLACLSNDVRHFVNEGQVRTGKDAFRAFCDHMSHCYREELTDMVIFEAEGGTRAAAEYIVNGTYLATDEGLPEARGQTYRLPAGSFFSL